MKILFRLGLLGVFLFTLSVKSFADNPTDVTQMVNMSLEDLMNTKVTSASGREQKQREVANSMFIITKEDIKRWGAHNIPDLFYHVPGMQVRKIDGNRYFVSIRAYGSLAQGSLLVLVDNVVVFNPLKDGTEWELLPVPLDEIERIEIIRGPGGPLYSSNAEDGVINIITKKASDKDNYVATRAGSMHFLQDNIGVGQKIGNLSLRGFYQGDHDSGFSYLRGGMKVPDTSNDQIGGLKAEYDWSPDTSLILDGKDNEFTGINNGSPNATSPLGDTTKNPGYQRAFSAQFQQKVNDVYDYNVHLDAMSIATSYQSGTYQTGNDEKADSYSFKTQHNLKYDFLGSQITSFGLEARYIKFNDNVDFLPLGDPHQTQKVDSFFIQDEYRPIDKLILSAGLRITGNTNVIPKEGLLYEPRWSAVYLLNDEQSVRAVITKAYRTPSMFDRDLDIFVAPGGLGLPNTPLSVRGSQTLSTEKDWTYETGWHGDMLDKKLDMDAAVYYTTIKDPIFPWTDSYIFTSPGIYETNGQYFLPVSNNGQLHTYGAELSASYKLTEDLTLKGDYTFTNCDPIMNNDPGTGYARAYSLNLSKHQAGSGLSYTKNAWTIDLYAKWISKYTDTAVTGMKFPSYWDSTIRVAYAFKMPFMKMKENDAEFEVVGNDLFGAHTVESSNLYIRQPDAYAGLKVKF